MASHLLDTSALIAYLASESGADRIQALRHQCALPFIVLTELSYVVWQRQGPLMAQEVYSHVSSWHLPTVFPDEPIVRLAGEMKAVHRLGIADSYVAACAISLGAVLITKDPDFNVLARDLKLLQLTSHH